MRHYFARPPAPPLAHLVEYLWASRGAPAHRTERVVPTGTLELVISLTDDKGRIYDASGREQQWGEGAAVAGAYRRPFLFDTSETASAVGVHFKPGFAGVVLGLPPGELVDRHVSLESLWGRGARALTERLREARTTALRFAILEAELVSRIANRVHPVVTFALAELARPQVRVGDIAKRSGLSQRRLIDLFTAAVGITPKRFGRVMRFHRATALARDAALDWTRIAYECGYYDQAHLIRDFHELADATPSELVRASVHVKEHHQLAVLEA